MAKSGVLHTIWAFLKHRLTAWNTTGEGIHSPYLFELVRFIMRDENMYYCFADIERRREMMLACEDSVDVIDFGSAGSPEGLRITRRVCDIAKNHLETPKMGQLLFRIVVWLGQQEKRPLQILELGTSLGISTAYLASAGSCNNVLTMEGSEELLKIAQGNWKVLKLENIEWQTGNIDDTLFECAREKWDMVYIDANHTFEATMRYAEYLLPRLTEKGILIIDDIHYSSEMEKAWCAIKENPLVTTTMDLFHAGLVFVDPHYLKRHYKIRI
jgi:predicted O-methyltransferase YrrM